MSAKASCTSLHRRAGKIAENDPIRSIEYDSTNGWEAKLAAYLLGYYHTIRSASLGRR